MTAEAFPLAWPDGWPRTDPSKRDDGARFREKGAWQNAIGDGFGYYTTRGVTFDAARKKLANELERLGAKHAVLSTNVPLRLDGEPRAGAIRAGIDPGVAIYFQYRKRPMAMACDRFSNIAANVRSLGLAIEAIRQLERHGGGHMMEKAFSGFAALPAPDARKPWREVFGVKPDWRGDLRALYVEKAKQRHSDTGGADTLMAELNVAYADAKQELGL